MIKLEFGEYETLYEAGSGGCGQVYFAIKKEDTNKKPCNGYILKTLNEIADPSDIKILKHEIDILNILKTEPPSPYVPFLHGFDKDYYQIVNKKKIAKPYCVIDYFSRGNLYYYTNIYYFSETHAKVIFKKILEAVKYCHDRNICHLDIKPENITFNKTFEPCLIDFGYANNINNENGAKIDYKYQIGTEPFECPEMWEKIKFNGDKADIFSLGVVLIILVSGSYGFLTSETTDRFYKYIIENSKEAYEIYWNDVVAQTKVKNIVNKWIILLK